jgi:SAM-dependent methyltransferase
MNTPEEVKKVVREKYTEIVERGQPAALTPCCGADGCCGSAEDSFAEDYTKLEGYAPEADYGLGCGIPTAFAHIRSGDTVVDLGSGAGNDVFIARKQAGPEGRVIGVDMTPAMIDKARANAAKLGYANVEFRLGEIEALPVGAAEVDVVISNCVLNLVPDKQKAFTEIYRVLKPGGRFTVSDVVLTGPLPAPLLQAAALYAGCVSGAMQREEYLATARAAGFEEVTVVKEKRIRIADDVLRQYVSADEAAAFQSTGARLVSVTVEAVKPVAQRGNA